MKNGRIELHSWEGRLLGGYDYSCPKERERVIGIWKKRYMHKINLCYFQIKPSVDIDRLKVCGKNDNVGPKRKYRVKENKAILDPMRKADPNKAEMIFFRRGNTNPRSRH